MQWHLLLQWNRHPLDWVLGGGLIARSADQQPGGQRTAEHLRLMANRHNASTANWSTRLLLGLVVAEALGLLFDGRYRPLSWPVLAAPAALLFALRLLGETADP